MSTVAIFRLLTPQPSFLVCPSARPHSGGIVLGRTKACRYYNATEFRSGSQDDKKRTRVFILYCLSWHDGNRALKKHGFLRFSCNSLGRILNLVLFLLHFFFFWLCHFFHPFATWNRAHGGAVGSSLIPGLSCVFVLLLCVKREEELRVCLALRRR